MFSINDESKACSLIIWSSESGENCIDLIYDCLNASPNMLIILYSFESQMIEDGIIISPSASLFPTMLDIFSLISIKYTMWFYSICISSLSILEKI